MPHTVQGSQAWLDWRNNKIGASDACIIMGVSPWNTPYELWQIKTRQVKPKPMAPHMQRGHDLEDGARDWLAKETGMVFGPVVIEDGTPREFMVASLDGLSFPDGKVITEIKHINAKDHQCAIDGNVPEKYWPQVQHQLACLPLAEKSLYLSCLFVRPEERVLLKVERDEKYIEKMLVEIDKFWNCVQTLTPPPLMDRDFKPICDNDIIIRAKRYAELAPLVKEFDALKVQLKKDCNGENVTDGVIKICNYSTKGRIDYDSIDKLDDVDLEEYRKPSSQCVRITINK